MLARTDYPDRDQGSGSPGPKGNATARPEYFGVLGRALAGHGALACVSAPESEASLGPRAGRPVASLEQTSLGPWLWRDVWCTLAKCRRMLNEPEDVPAVCWLVVAIRGPWPGIMPGLGSVMDLQGVRASAFVSGKPGQHPEYCQTSPDGAVPQSSLTAKPAAQTPFNCVHGLRHWRMG